MSNPSLPFDLSKITTIKSLAMANLVVLGLIFLQMIRLIFENEFVELNQYFWLFFSFLTIYLIIRLIDYVEAFLRHKYPYLKNGNPKT